jgi:hypothetical protein
MVFNVGFEGWETCELDVFPCLLPALVKLLVCQCSQQPVFGDRELTFQGSFLVLLGL